MKKLILPITFLLLASLGLFFAGCGNDGGGGLDTLLKITQDNPDLDSLVIIIQYIDEFSTVDPQVAATLDDDGETLTVFGPSDAAFIAVFGDNDADGIVEYEDLRDTLPGTDAENADFLLDVLGYHEIPDQSHDTTEIAAQDGGSIGPTGSSAANFLDVSVVGTVITLTPDDSSSSADITDDKDIEASNGIAHVIDAIIGL